MNDVALEITEHFVNALAPLFPAPVQFDDNKGIVIAQPRVPEDVQKNLLMAVHKILEAARN